LPLDIRVLATSNRDLAEEVRQGRFREDLFYRLNVFPLQIPPLRHRPGDILPLARHFLALHGARMGRSPRLTPAAEARIAAYAWPGNVRELENAVQRALIMASGDTVEAEHLPFGAMGETHVAGAAPPAPPAPAPIAAPPPAPQTAAGAAAVPAAMRDLERQHILDTLAAVGGSRKKAVALLGISERTLRYKLAQYRDEGVLPEGW
jgi:two-component system response regulator FlrC